MEIRHAALKCVIKIIEHNSSYDETLEFFANKVNNPPDLVNTVAGTIKSRLALDYFIELVSSRRVKKLSPTVRNILRLAVFELEYLKHPDYAVVNSYAGICKELDKKAVSFVNAVLRNFIRKRPEIKIEDDDLSIKYSHPDWLVKRWANNYGIEAAKKILEYNNQPPKLCLRINTLKVTKDRLLQFFEQNKINFREVPQCEDCLIIESRGNIRNIPGYKEGLWVVQGAASAMVARILGPEPGEKILDLCAAPGAKTTHIASVMNDTGEITAVDISPERLEKITGNCERLGIKSVKTIEADASEIKLNEEFDRILVDAPCSNTGVFGKRPDARWRRKPGDIDTLAGLQLKILTNAAGMLKPGGGLVYSTCSIEPEENIQVVEKFLSLNKCFQPEFSKLILQSEQDMDGFFIARMRKNCDN